MKRKVADGVSSFLSMNEIDNDQTRGGGGGTKTFTGIAATTAPRGGEDPVKAVERKKYSKCSVNMNKQEMRSVGEEQEGLIRGLMRGLSVEYGIQTDEEEDPYGPEYYQWEREAEAAREHTRRASNLSD